jgi:hypothetical protein
LRGELELSILLPRFAPFLSLIEDVAPSPLAQSAAEMKAEEVGWRDVLAKFCGTASGSRTPRL